jgi:CBS domain-containing protein
MRVREVMTRQVYAARPEMPLKEVAVFLVRTASGVVNVQVNIRPEMAGS